MIAVTGSSGFVGRALYDELVARGFGVRGVVRRKGALPRYLERSSVAIENIGASTDWSPALTGIDSVIHCAARVHIMQESKADALAKYRSVNVIGTKRLAEQAVELGVRRLVYLSSIKVNGECTVPGAPFSYSSAPAPVDAYSTSKWEAEQALWEVSGQTGLEVIVIRAPLVYGPEVKGNFRLLLQLVSRDVPLPFGRVDNLRSLIGLGNLVDLLIRCVDHPSAAGQTYLVSDGDDLSTPDLIRVLAKSMRKSARLWPLPVGLLRFGGRVAGKRAQIERLIGSLQVDCAHTRAALSWTPPMSVEAELQKTVDWFRGQL